MRQNVVAICSVITVAALAVSGCVSSQSGTTFSRSEAITAQRTYWGEIISVSEGKIEGTKSGLGAVAGGVLGGVSGRAVGGGSGKNIATVGLALAGAAAGAMAEDAITSQRAYSLSVKLDDGRVFTIVQNANTAFVVGQRVKVLESNEGRMRVQAD